MLRNYLTIAFRNLRRHRGYTLLNVGGLAVGMACCLLILLFVQDELGYDRFHEKADRIYRVLDIRMKNGVGERSSSAPSPLAEALRDAYPGQIEATVRFFNFAAPTLALAYTPPSGDVRAFNEPRMFFTDPTLFEVFDFPLQQGNTATALSEPRTLVLTPAMARKYFGDEDPVGKTLRFEGTHDFRVTGVLAPLPASSHLQFDFLASFASLDDPAVIPERLRTSWIWNPTWTYALLGEGVEPATLEAQFPDFVQTRYPESRRDRVTLHLQPLTDIHLYSRLDNEIGPNSDVAYVYIFSAIAVFVLLIACINFTNLATARASQRAREVGVRKALGAGRGQLIRQFLGESLLLGLLAVLVAVLLVEALLPLLNAVSGKSLTFNLASHPLFWLGLLGLAGLVSVAAGAYPAFFLAAFRPTQVLKNQLPVGKRDGAALLRKGLVVVQFTLSIVLIIGTMGVYSQLQFLRDAQLGFDEEQVVMLPVYRTGLPLQFDKFKERVAQQVGVEAVTLVEKIPGKDFNTGGFQPEGMAEGINFQRLQVRPGVVETLGLEMVAGRAFSEEQGEQDDEVLINEAMVRYLGWGAPEQALGRRFTPEPGASYVVGVVKDFHYKALHEEIAPFVLEKMGDDPNAATFFGRYVAVRLQPGDVAGTLAGIQGIWQDFLPTYAFEAVFLDDELNAQYRGEENLSKVAGAFTLLALLVACLGLFGLATFTAQQRTKEIGIRKVLGATVPGLVALLSKDFLQLVALAFVVAAPFAYFAMERWLQDFAYRTALPWWIFLIAGALALAVALLTVSYQALRAAVADPVESLRYE